MLRDHTDLGSFTRKLIFSFTYVYLPLVIHFVHSSTAGTIVTNSMLEAFTFYSRLFVFIILLSIFASFFFIRRFFDTFLANFSRNMNKLDCASCNFDQIVEREGQCVINRFMILNCNAWLSYI